MFIFDVAKFDETYRQQLLPFFHSNGRTATLHVHSLASRNSQCVLLLECYYIAGLCACAHNHLCPFLDRIRDLMNVHVVPYRSYLFESIMKLTTKQLR